MESDLGICYFLCYFRPITPTHGCNKPHAGARLARTPEIQGRYIYIWVEMGLTALVVPTALLMDGVDDEGDEPRVGVVQVSFWAGA